MEDVKKNAVKAGILVLLSVFTIVWSISFLQRCEYTQQKMNLKVRFRFLDGLGLKSPVRISGGEQVGIVNSFEYANSSVYVQLALKDEMRNFIPKNENTIFAIFTNALLGGRYVNITLGDFKEQQEYYQNGDIIEGQDPVSLDLLLLGISSWLGDEKGGQTIAEILNSIRYFIENLNGILDDNKKSIKAIVSNLRVSFNDLSIQLESLVQNLNLISQDALSISQKNKEEIGILVQSISSISYDISSILKRMKEGRGSVGRLLSEDSLYEEANKAIKNAKDLMQVLKEKPWLLLYRK